MRRRRYRRRSGPRFRVRTGSGRCRRRTCVLGRDPELLGDDLRERRLVACPCVCAEMLTTACRGCTRRSAPSFMSMCLRGPAPTLGEERARRSHQLASRAREALAAEPRNPRSSRLGALAAYSPESYVQPVVVRTSAGRDASVHPQVDPSTPISSASASTIRRQVHGLCDPERAPKGDAARLVRVDRLT
jgi:hypothetical protein